MLLDHQREVKVVVMVIVLRIRATEYHLPYEITQCYLPPDTSEHTLLTPVRQDGTRFTYPEGMEGWVYLGDWLAYIPRWFTRPQTVTHPSTNPTEHGRESNSQPIDYKSDALTTVPPSHHINRVCGEVPADTDVCAFCKWKTQLMAKYYIIRTENITCRF